MIWKLFLVSRYISTHPLTQNEKKYLHVISRWIFSYQSCSLKIADSDAKTSKLTGRNHYGFENKGP